MRAFRMFAQREAEFGQAALDRLVLREHFAFHVGKAGLCGLCKEDLCQLRCHAAAPDPIRHYHCKITDGICILRHILDHAHYLRPFVAASYRKDRYRTLSIIGYESFQHRWREFAKRMEESLVAAFWG